MADRNAQGSPSDPSGEYRPFDDPTHPSWYSDPEQPAQDAAPSPQGQAASARNPYADQPLAGPYGNGQPQYPIHGGYPVVANPPGQGQAGQGQYGSHVYGSGQAGQYGHGGTPAGRAAGVPYPAMGSRPSSALGITSMVLGIVGLVTFGFVFVPQILAVVFGHLSLRKEPQARGFAIAGLVMGYLMCGLWALFILLGFASVASLLAAV